MIVHQQTNFMLNKAVGVASSYDEENQRSIK